MAATWYSFRHGQIRPKFVESPLRKTTPENTSRQPSPTRAGISCQQISLNVKHRRYRSVGTEGPSVGKTPSPPLSRRYRHQNIDTYKKTQNSVQKCKSQRHCSEKKKESQRVGQTHKSTRADVQRTKVPFSPTLSLKNCHSEISPRLRLTPPDILRRFSRLSAVHRPTLGWPTS